MEKGANSLLVSEASEVSSTSEQVTGVSNMQIDVCDSSQALPEEHSGTADLPKTGGSVESANSPTCSAEEIPHSEVSGTRPSEESARYSPGKEPMSPEQSPEDQQKEEKVCHKKVEVPDPRIAPKVDCPEKIVFCIDMSSDMDKFPFKLGNSVQFSPVCMIKRTIEVFVQSKLKINNKHEFAIMGFHNTAMWVRNFTSELKKISSAMDELNQMNICEDSALPSVFKLISVVAAELPSFQKPDVVPPPFVFRVILIYGRSHCLPENEKVERVLCKLKASPYFFLDILYVHEPPSLENKCQEIFERLCDFDEKGTSYIFEVARNTTKLHNCMAKLLAHPLQRPLQKNACYKIQPIKM